MSDVDTKTYLHAALSRLASARELLIAARRENERVGAMTAKEESDRAIFCRQLNSDLQHLDRTIARVTGMTLIVPQRKPRRHLPVFWKHLVERRTS